ncbi:BON domain-containing protein [Niveibacterium sp. SC-1]|uniref:BON domain-containing protein n=1 Tax=Niveibacterium sp. SC-1 TaxID=3135646 RepID=UPI00311DDCE2
MKHAALILSLAVVGASLTACNKDNSDKTLGQQVDQSVQESKDKMAEAQQKAEAAGDKMKQEASEASDKMKEQANAAGKVLDDTAITASVRAKIVAEPDLSNMDVKVDTKEGVVTLDGKAKSADAKDRATLVARSVDGVKDVNNNLSVQ